MIDDFKHLSDMQMAELYFADRKNETVREELRSRKLSLNVRILKEKFFTAKSHNVASPLQKIRDAGAMGVDRSARLIVANKKKK
jgi:hypothetical protein